MLCTEKQRQSGEFPTQVYFEESSLQFQKACVPDHWFSGFPEQGFGDERGKVLLHVYEDLFSLQEPEAGLGALRAQQHQPLGFL